MGAWVIGTTIGDLLRGTIIGVHAPIPLLRTRGVMRAVELWGLGLYGEGLRAQLNPKP